MARGFETYVMEGVAPNIDTENIFYKFKRYLLDIYKGLKPEQINDDVREFFDKMLSGEEEMPDITGLEGKIEHIGEVIKGALKGEEVNFEGLSMDDLKKLTKLAHMRRPRKPKNLKQKIRSAGGIDIELAKSLGIYDSKKGNEGGFFKKNGEFKLKPQELALNIDKLGQDIAGTMKDEKEKLEFLTSVELKKNSLVKAAQSNQFNATEKLKQFTNAEIIKSATDEITLINQNICSPYYSDLKKANDRFLRLWVHSDLNNIFLTLESRMKKTKKISNEEKE